jgi:hypothetical protein
MNNYREHYKPDTGVSGPYTRTHVNLADMVLIWLSGCAIGLAIGLIVTGN